MSYGRNPTTAEIQHVWITDGDDGRTEHRIAILSNVIEALNDRIEELERTVGKLMAGEYQFPVAKEDEST